MDELAPSFPAGVEWFLPFDATIFINAAIHEVVVTLLHRGGAGVHRDAGVPAELPRHPHSRRSWCPWRSWARSSACRSSAFSINQLTLFGMVLAIGIVVDDAIVVIESVERIMREEHLPPKEATRKAMTQITNPIIAISVVLAAVFIPSALQSGSVGMIYQQFAMTIAISMGFSAFLALVADAGAVRARCCGPSISRKTGSSSCSTAATTARRSRTYVR